MNAQHFLIKRRAAVNDISYKTDAFLRSCGWTCSSDYPGSRWLWRKAFPESKTQWCWVGEEKVPYAARTIDGATTEIALDIEAAWQELFADGEKEHRTKASRAKK